MTDPVPLTGEPLALDLVNTRPAAGDLLATVEALRAWLRLQADRLPEAAERAAALTGADLAAVHRIRAATARLLHHARHGTAPGPADLETLHRAQRAAPAITELAWTGTALVAARRRTGPPGDRLAAALAEAAAGLLADPAVTRIRECAAEDCVLLFLPAHPRRRWCSPTGCGNRARVARHYRRRRGGDHRPW